MADKYSRFKGIGLGPTSDGAFEIGDFATSNKDTFFALDAVTRPKALDICADDGGTAIAVGGGENVMALRSRMLLRTAIATGAITVFGAQAQLKVGPVSIVSTGKGSAGLWAYFEASGSTLGGTFAAIRAVADVPSGATLSSGGILAGVMIDSMGLDGTTNGDLSCVYIPNPDAGTWDYFLQTGNAPGFISSLGSGYTAVHKVACKIGGTICYIPLITGT